MMNLCIGEWPAITSDDIDSIKRIESAKKLTKKIVSFDPDKKIIAIQGSSEEPYVATLSECSCPDYIYRRNPCKHIFALAFELGMMDDLPVYKKGKGSFNAEDEMAKYREMYEHGEISGDSYVKICSVLAKL